MLTWVKEYFSGDTDENERRKDREDQLFQLITLVPAGKPAAGACFGVRERREGRRPCPA
jgi:hypothetical protein